MCSATLFCSSIYGTAIYARANIFSLGCIFLDILTVLCSYLVETSCICCKAGNNISFHNNLPKATKWLSFLSSNSNNATLHPDYISSKLILLTLEMLSQEPSLYLTVNIVTIVTWC